MNKPLALKMAPNSLKEVLGQKELIGKDKILTNLVKNGKLFSMILYGPPGVGKTSLALSIARAINRKFVKMTKAAKNFLKVCEKKALLYSKIMVL